jgi:hypothetical protein
VPSAGLDAASALVAFDVAVDCGRTSLPDGESDVIGARLR